MKIKASAITLDYFCSDCGITSTQLLSKIVENGTHTCDCGVDMKLSEKVEIDDEALKAEG